MERRVKKKTRGVERRGEDVEKKEQRLQRRRREDERPTIS